jgi:hypothetical protein
MSLMNSTSEKLRRATQLWHAFLTITGKRFELAQFLKDAAIEKQTLDAALASGDQKLVALAQDWLRDTGQAVPNVVASRVVQPGALVPAVAALPNTAPEAAKPARYLRGVR